MSIPPFYISRNGIKNVPVSTGTFLLLQKGLSQFFPGFGREISGRNVKHGLGAGHTFPVHTGSSSGVADQHTGGELRVGAQLQGIFDHLLGIVVFTGCAASQYKTAMGNTGVIPVHLLLRDEMNRSIVLVKVVGHGLDLPFDLLQIGAGLATT